jgi:hypothetical protein
VHAESTTTQMEPRTIRMKGASRTFTERASESQPDNSYGQAVCHWLRQSSVGRAEDFLKSDAPRNMTKATAPPRPCLR